MPKYETERDLKEENAAKLFFEAKTGNFIHKLSEEKYRLDWVFYTKENGRDVVQYFGEHKRCYYPFSAFPDHCISLDKYLIAQQFKNDLMYDVYLFVTYDDCRASINMSEYVNPKIVMFGRFDRDNYKDFEPCAAFPKSAFKILKPLTDG